MLVSPTINSLHGRLRTIVGTNPAAGAEISQTVPDRRRWKLHALIYTLVTDETEADRVSQVFIDDGTNRFAYIYTGVTQAASLTQVYSLTQVGQNLAVANTVVIGSLPPLVLGPGYQFGTATFLIKPADDYGAPIFLIEEWIDP